MKNENLHHFIIHVMEVNLLFRITYSPTSHFKRDYILTGRYRKQGNQPLLRLTHQYKSGYFLTRNPTVRKRMLFAEKAEAA